MCTITVVVDLVSFRVCGTMYVERGLTDLFFICFPNLVDNYVP